VADFERQWEEALACGGGRWLIYPTDSPTTQAELDEEIKAVQVRELLDKFGLNQGIVLEYGCGAAGMSVYLANHGFRAIACDISVNALQVARLNAEHHLVKGADTRFYTVAGDTFRLPFADQAFDVVMSYGLLEHFAPDVLDEALNEAMRTLRPGGLFVADIAHSRFSVRTVATWVNLIGSLIIHAVTLRWQRLSGLPVAYLDPLYENDLDDQAWARALQFSGLHDVQVRICRPFPPLALSGWSERLYVQLLQRLRPLWEWFDRAQPRWGRKWGWIYLVWGTK